MEWGPFNEAMRAHGLVIAGGQGKWAGKILRFGHMGEVGIDEAYAAARATTLSILGSLRRELGDLDRITGWVFDNKDQLRLATRSAGICSTRLTSPRTRAPIAARSAWR